MLERAFAKVSPLKLLAAAGALAVLIKAPALWFIWAGLAAYAVFGPGKSTSDKLNPLRKSLSEAESQWFNALLAWQKRAGGSMNFFSYTSNCKLLGTSTLTLREQRDAKLIDTEAREEKSNSMHFSKTIKF
jgi:hypothetical protein